MVAIEGIRKARRSAGTAQSVYLVEPRSNAARSQCASVAAAS